MVSSDDKAELRRRRLAALKSKARAGLDDNRDQLVLERRARQLQSIEKKESVVDVAEPDDPKQKLMNYTIEETERWNELQARKAARSADAGFHNFNQLASMTYKKELQGLKVDKEKYRQLKQAATELAPNVPREHDFAFTPSADASASLAAAIRESDKRKQKKRKAPDDSMSINERNTQFNQKLQRDYDKPPTD